ncbi:MAG: hypothetical protein KHX03_09780 [Clostridium sp.]|nr:hypothetical protein [Clostridium sp.]
MNPFLIIPELKEMLNKIELFSKRECLTSTHRDLYLDLKVTLKTLISIEKGKEDERRNIA